MERRNLRLPSYDAVLADAESLAASGYERAGNWGLAQICNHLAVALEMSLDGFPSRFPWPVRLVARWFVLPRMMRHQVFRRTVAAPAYLLPLEAQDEQDALDRLRAVISRLKEHTGEMRPSPIFGRLTTNEWREVHLWPCEHHLSFLQPKRTTTSPS